MRKNYNFKINPKPISSEQINAHKDFDALMASFENAPVAQKESKTLVRRLMYWGSAAAAAIAMLFVVKNVYTSQKASISESTFFAQKACIDPPTPTALPNFKRFAVNVNQGGVYEYQSGSRLIVPSAAFMNDRGGLVEGEVDIFYREYTDYLDFMLSGIPMKYDSLGQEYILQSSGIVEIYAEKNGKRIELTTGKSIKVEMLGQVMLEVNGQVPNYNVYHLDTTSRTWLYQNVDLMQVLDEELAYDDPLYAYKKVWKDELNDITAKRNTALLAIENNIPKPNQPIQPQQRNSNQITFDLAFLKDKLPENDDLLYSGTIWQLSPNNPPIDPNAFQVEWEDAKVKKISGRDYELQLISGETVLSLTANPILSGRDYENGMQLYREDMKVYAIQMETREKNLLQDKINLNKRFDEQKRAAKERYLDALASTGIDEGNLYKITPRKVINTFHANTLGMWICALPVVPEMMSLKARFVDENGDDLAPAVAYIADRSRNTSVKFLAQRGATITFDNTAENILCIMLENDKIAIFRPEQFKNIIPKKGKYTFKMEIVAQEMLKKFDFVDVLQF